MSLAALSQVPRGGQEEVPSLAALLGLTSLGGDIILPADRSRAYEAFIQADKAFGRYSRLKLRWGRLPVKTPHFAPLDLRPLGMASEAPLPLDIMRAGDPRTVRPSLPLTTAPLMPAPFMTPWDELVFAGWREALSLSWTGTGRRDPVGVEVTGQGGLVLEPIFAEVTPGAEGTLFLRWTGSAEPSFHLTALQATVGEGGRLKIVLLHDGKACHHHLTGRIEVGRDARVEVFGAWMGGAWTVARFSAALAAPGASWNETHLIAVSGKEHMDLDSQVQQSAKGTSCDIQVKAVAADDSRAVFTGNILMDEGAQLSKALLADHILLLSKGARADSIPGLEIKAADVQASHAASVGQVDEEELFYLQSRGLTESEARHLIIVGFLRSLLDRAPLSALPEILDPVLEAKLRA